MTIASRSLLFVFLFVLTTMAWGQSSMKYSSEYADFYRAEELFEKEQYSASREVFTEFLNEFHDRQDPQYIKARYYQGISALELYNNDAIKLLLGFIHDYPESIYKNDIYFKIGEHFYQKKKYKDAREWLEKTDPTEIDTASLAAYHFKLGYSNFQLEDYTPARNEFYEIKDGNSNYSAPALYYYSYIAYKNGAYQEALDGFLALEKNNVFKKEAPYYITQINYLLGDYEKVTSLAAHYTAEEGGIEQNPAEMNLIIGDSYYKTKRYDEAVDYLEDYYHRKKTTRGEDYALAYSYYQSKRYDDAIKIFDYISQIKDTLGQVSFYHIAQSYLQEEKLNYARTAFKSAADFDFNPKIQEDALYNYAVLSYKLDYNPYNEAIKAFELFLTKFPQSEREDNVYNYLVNVYSSTKNYAAALKSLDRIPRLNIKLKTAYQVASYNMGITAYERGDYTACIETLKGVSKYDIDPQLTGKAKFWAADAHFMLKEWSQAINGYRTFLMVPGMNDLKLKESAYYNIAYAYYMQEDWVQAIPAFRTFTQLNNIKDHSKLADAYARIADCYYTKEHPDFQKAAINYEKSLQYESTKEDRILYALAKVYKVTPGKRNQQIKSLEKILDNYSKSSYVIPAIFDIAKAYKNDGNYSKALTYFNKIINNYPNNNLVKESLIEIADMEFKEKHYDKSESYFKRVLNEYSLDNETCKRVTNGIIDVYRAMRQQDKIIELGKKYACAEITKDDEEIFFYETASELYANDKYDEAIPEIKKYLKRYPKGQFSIQLTSYLANIYYQRNEMESAMVYYKQVTNQPTSAYTEEALIRLSKTLYNEKKYAEALPYYRDLDKLASKPRVIFNTRVGLMRTNYLLDNYDEAASYAVKALDDDLLDDETIRVEGNYIAGISFFHIQEYKKAITYLRWTADNTGKERGTEALYTLTDTYYQLQDYEKAEQLHNELLQRKPTYDYWIAKSLILQAKVFMATDDMFQAEQTIDLVIRNYPNKEDGILEDATNVKSEIMEIKDQPKEIEGDLNRTIDINEENNE